MSNYKIIDLTPMFHPFLASEDDYRHFIKAVSEKYMSGAQLPSIMNRDRWYKGTLGLPFYPKHYCGRLTILQHFAEFVRRLAAWTEGCPDVRLPPSHETFFQSLEKYEELHTEVRGHHIINHGEVVQYLALHYGYMSPVLALPPEGLVNREGEILSSEWLSKNIPELFREVGNDEEE